MEPLKTARVINITLAILLGLCFGLSWVADKKNGELVSRFNQERLKSEALLSEKLESQKELQKFKDRFFDLRDEGHDHKQAVKIADTKNKELNARLDQLLTENRLLRSKKTEAVQSGLNFENKLQAVYSLTKELETEKSDLKNANEILKNANASFSNELAKRNLTDIDNVHFQAITSNPSRLTIRAAKTKKIVGYFDVPGNIINLNFKIYRADGRQLTNEDGAFISDFSLLPVDQVASAVNKTSASTLMRHQLVYAPTNKLSPGTYKIEVNNDSIYLETVYVTLQ